MKIVPNVKMLKEEKRRMLDEFGVSHLLEDKHLKFVRPEAREILEEARKTGVIGKLNASI